MAVDDKHPDYTAMYPTWEKCRDTSTGLRALRAKGSKYLPLLGGHKDDNDKDYIAYKERGQYFNAVSRTKSTMKGHIFRKQPKIELPAVIDDFKSDIDLKGTSLEGFIKKVTDDVIEVGRVGILVEYPERENLDPITVDEARSQGLRPYLTSYTAENIINWRLERVNNSLVLVDCYLWETYLDADGEEQAQIRRLVLDGGYIQEIYRKNDSDWELYDTKLPTKNGNFLTKIPFYIVSTEEAGFEIVKPPLEDLAETCIGYYKNSADYEQALHVCGSPTPYVTGVQNDKDVPELHLGPNTFIKLPPNAEAGFMQIGAEGVSALKEAMEDKKSEMSAQGAKMLEADKRMVESAESHSIKRGGENSILATLAGTVEMVIHQALSFMTEWLDGTVEDLVLELNKDYLPSPLDAAMVKETRESYLSGVISFETMFDILTRGEFIPEEVTYEDEIDRKEQDGPALSEIDDDTE